MQWQNKEKMKEVLPVVKALIQLLSSNEDMQELRADKKRFRLKKKQLRYAQKIRKQTYKEFKKDGFTEEETAILDILDKKILNRKTQLA